jgi:uncharacterized membrane protein
VSRHTFGDAVPPEQRPGRIRLSAVGLAWGLFKARWGTWILAGLIVVAGNAALGSLVSAITGQRLPLGIGFRLEVPPARTLIEAILTAVLNGFLLGGLFRMACKQVRREPIGIGDLFSITDVFTELAIGLAIYACACTMLLAFGIIPGFILAGVWMFVVPLIVDARLTALDAIRESWRALKGQWLAATIFHFVIYSLAGLGACCFLVGLLITWPLYCLSIAVLYGETYLTKPPSAFAKPFSRELGDF